MSRAIVQILLVSKVYMVDFRGSTVRIANSRFSLFFFLYKLTSLIVISFSSSFIFSSLNVCFYPQLLDCWNRFYSFGGEFPKQGSAAETSAHKQNLFHTVEIYKKKWQDKFTTRNFDKFIFAIFSSLVLWNRDTHTHTANTHLFLSSFT